MEAKAKPLSHLSAGKGFIQESRDFNDAFLNVYRTCPSTAILWRWLMMHMSHWNTVPFSQSRFITGTGLPKATLYRAMDALIERNFILRGDRTIHLNWSLVWRGSQRANLEQAPICGAPWSPAKTEKRDVAC